MIKREASQVAVKLTDRMAASGLDIESLVTARRKLSDLPHATESEITSLLKDLRNHLSAQQEHAGKSTELDPSAILALAKGLLAQQEWLNAGAEFERYARSKPDDWEASYARGVAFANARGGESTNLSALRACNDAIAFFPQTDRSTLRARLFAYRGAILKRLFRLDEAEADLRIARRNAKGEYERADIAYNFACIYAITGRREEMLTEIRSIKQDRACLRAVQAHLHDYFAAYKNDHELLGLIHAA